MPILGGRITPTRDTVQIKQLIVNVRAGLRHVIETTPQLGKTQRWFALARYIVDRIVAFRRTPNELLTFAPTG